MNQNLLSTTETTDSVDLMSPAREQRSLSLEKSGHHFFMTYETGDETIVLQAIAEMVDDPATPFDWFDAASLGHQLGQHLAGELAGELSQAA